MLARRPWTVVVPVKGGPGAKSRLRFLAPDPRARLAEAMATDTVAAAAVTPAVAQVVVVSGDAATQRWACDLGAAVVDDPALGLDAAVLAGAADRRGGVAVLLGDHPALRPCELDLALAHCAAHERAVVPDAEGTGTALLTARAVPLRPAFGPGSHRRHREGGHISVSPESPSLRLDVDDAASLTAAARLGVGPRTAAAMAATLGHVQATIHTDGDDGGSVLLDDGREIPYAAAALAGSGLRRLRPGQRVSIELDATRDEITRVWVVGIGVGETIR